MKGDIRLSRRHGVNPSIGVCFYCGEDNGEVVLPGLLPNDAEAPKRAVWHREPCEKCKGWMAQGVILIGVRDGESGDNPFRSGHFAVVKEEAARRIFTGEAGDAAVKTRVAFIEASVGAQIGLWEL